MMRRSLAALLLLAPAAARGQSIDTLALRAHTHFLAHDLLRGRDTGSEGEWLAALYIISELRRMGIEGAGPGGEYLQRVPLRRARVDHAASRVVLRAAGTEQTFRSGEHFTPATGGAAAFRDFAGELLFAGTAEHAAAALAGHTSLDGRVITVLGTLGTHAATLVQDWIRRGAAGVVLLVPDRTQFELLLRSRGDDRFFLDAPADDPIWQPPLPVLIAGPELSRAVLAAAQIDPGALAGTGPFTAVDLGRSIRASIRVVVDDVAAHNVAALIPGRDPAQRHEVVAFTAHYDHLGVGEPDANGDSIYNGFSDNAAGVAMLLAIADALRQDPPARSVLFLFFTGEERGLLGSTYYASAPLIPLERTVAVINLDAGAPPAPPISWRISGGTRSSLGEEAARIARERGWTAQLEDARPNSDHWPFLRQGVPAAFIIPGRDWEGLTAAEQERLFRRWDRYHQAGDEWVADFPWTGLRRYAEFGLALGRRIADAPARPRLLP
ncbi:MAG TPA: M28 family peptidase [Longimicrobiales bacterium]